MKLKQPGRIFCLGVLLVCFQGQALAEYQIERNSELLLQTSLWTKHYSNDPEHTENQKLINAEWTFSGSGITAARTGKWYDDIRVVAGGARFKNSFDQPTVYLYAGGRYDYYETPSVRAYAKLTAGLLHGYKGEYKDKIPLNHFGVAPAILPAFGVEVKRINLEMIPFGTAGVMVNIGYVFR